MHSALSNVIDRLNMPSVKMAGVIAWSSPVLAFGNVSKSLVATVGINPSNCEFVDSAGVELEGATRRFHSLKSLHLKSWDDADASHLSLILQSYESYFLRNPYDAWFRRLDYVLANTLCSLYGEEASACHLDLVPYATEQKWSLLSTKQRAGLLSVSADTLAILLRSSPIRTIVLNGKSVVEQFQRLTNVQFNRTEMNEWALPRSKADVAGIAYEALVESLADFELPAPLRILGYNHNLQSSYGVTITVVNAIRDWVAEKTILVR